MTSIFEELNALIGKNRLKQNESLVTRSILKIDANAQFYTEINNAAELIRIVTGARERKIPVFILGSGARIESKDITGLVIKNNCHYFEKASMKGTIKQNRVGVEEVLVYTEAGVLMNQLVRFSIEEGLEGLEYQLGLPGTVGGAIYTNAKYMPKYLLVNKALQSVRILHENGELKTYNARLPHFVYTDGPWEETKDVILSAVFKLTPADKKMLWERGEEAVEFRNKIRNPNI